MRLLYLLLCSSLLLYSCSESNLKNDPDLDDNKTDYPPSVSGNSNIYPSDSVAKDTVY